MVRYADELGLALGIPAEKNSESITMRNWHLCQCSNGYEFDFPLFGFQRSGGGFTARTDFDLKAHLGNFPRKKQQILRSGKINQINPLIGWRPQSEQTVCFLLTLL